MALNKLSCPIPNNISPLSSGGFMLSIDKAPNVQFWCNEANLPGLSLGVATQASPFQQTPTPGDTLTFDSLNVQFIISSDMNNYYELWNWINSLGFPESWDQFRGYAAADTRGMKDNRAKIISDATLTILNNSNVPVRSVKFFDAFPTDLQSLQLQANNSDVVYLAGQATFQYSHWKFVD